MLENYGSRISSFFLSHNPVDEDRSARVLNRADGKTAHAVGGGVQRFISGLISCIGSLGRQMEVISAAQRFVKQAERQQDWQRTIVKQLLPGPDWESFSGHACTCLRMRSRTH